jgi:DNA primase
MMARFSRSFIDEVRHAADIVDLAGELTALRRRGRRFYGRCPFHQERTPSFSVEPSRGLFHCFGCNAGGDVIELYQRSTGLSFPAAIESLARRFGVAFPAAAPRPASDLDALAAARGFFSACLARPQGAAARAYLERRGVPSEVAARFQLGSAPPGWNELRHHLAGSCGDAVLLQAGLIARSRRGRLFDVFRDRLMIPLCRADGTVVGFAGRALAAAAQPKYLNTRETAALRKSEILYGLAQARERIRAAGRAVLVEGYFDVWALAAAGLGEAVAMMGSSLSPQQLAALRRLTPRIVQLFDADPAGRAAAFRTAPLLLAAGFEVRVATLPDSQDPDSLHHAHGNEALIDVVEKATDVLDHGIDILRASATTLRDQTAAISHVLRLAAAITDPASQIAYSRVVARELHLSLDTLLRLLHLRNLPERPAGAGRPAGLLELEFDKQCPRDL